MCPDITMCNNDTCPLRTRCHRYTAPFSPDIQSYQNFKWSEDNKGKITCEFYWPLL